MRGKRHRFNSCIGKIPWRRNWQPTPGFFPGESHGQRSLVGHSPWGCREWNTTEHAQCCLLGHGRCTVYLTDQRQKQIRLCLREKYYILSLLSLLLPTLFAFSHRSWISVSELCNILKPLASHLVSTQWTLGPNPAFHCFSTRLTFPDSPKNIPSFQETYRAWNASYLTGTMAHDFQIWHPNSHGDLSKWYHISQRLGLGLLTLKWEAGLKINNLLG